MPDLCQVSSIEYAKVNLFLSGQVLSYTVEAKLVNNQYVGTITKSDNRFIVTAPLGNNGEGPVIANCEGGTQRHPNILVTEVTLPAGIPGILYVPGDKYLIDLLICAGGFLSIRVTITRTLQISINTDLDDVPMDVASNNVNTLFINNLNTLSLCNTRNCPSNVCNNDRVPKIQVQAQTKIDG